MCNVRGTKSASFFTDRLHFPANGGGTVCLGVELLAYLFEGVTNIVEPVEFDIDIAYAIA